MKKKIVILTVILLLMLITSSTNIQKVQSTNTTPQISGNTEWKPDIVMLNVTNGTISWHVYPDYSVLDNGTILHRADISFSYDDTIYVTFPREWEYDYISPFMGGVSYNATCVWFTATANVHYYIYFSSTNTQDYPEFRESRIAFHNSKGESLSFDNFHTSIAISPDHLIRYAPNIDNTSMIAWWTFNEYSPTGGTYYFDDEMYSIQVYYGIKTGGYISDAVMPGVSLYQAVHTTTYADSVKTQLWAPFSIEFWMYWNGTETGDDQGLVVKFTKRLDTTGTAGYRSNINYAVALSKEHTILFYFTDSSVTNHTIESNMEITPNTWHHIWVGYDGSYMYIYIDGRLDNKKAETSTVYYTSYSSSGEHEFCVGGYLSSSFANGTPIHSSAQVLRGKMDEVRLYKRLPTSEEVWWHYSLALYYDGQKDMLGRTSSGSVTSYTSGVFGTASEFDGVDDYVGVFNDASLQQREGFTIITYFKANSGRSISLYRWRTYGAMLRLSNGYLYFSYYDHSAKLHTLASADTYTDNEWHLIVAVKTFDEMFLYIDGDLEVNTTITGEPDVYYGSGGGAIGRDGDASSGYFEGYIDELLLLNQPISPEMAENLWKLAKTYIGGYYTDTEFRSTWQIESDSPEDGNGYAEDFSDISEWDAVSAYRHVSTDGDIVNYTVDGTQTSTVWAVWGCTLSTNTTTGEYPFFEMRYKYAYESDPPDEYFYVELYHGIAKVGNVLIDYSVDDDFHIYRVNLLDKFGDVEWDRINIVLRAGAGDKSTVLVDWIRIYKIEGTTLTYTADIDSDDWITSTGGVLQIHANFETPNDEYIGVIYDIPDITDTTSIYVEARIKGFTEISMYGIDSGLIYWFFYSTDWMTVRLNPNDGSYQILDGSGEYLAGYNTAVGGLKDIRLVINDRSPYDSGEYDAFYDYVRIGYLDNEKIQDTNWEALLYPIYEHPKSGYVWFNVTDIFGNILVDMEPRAYATYQDFVLPLYSWKFKNAKDDTFIHINVSRSGFYWSEWLAPGEVARYDLYPGTYTLNVTYPTGSSFEVQLNVTQDYYWMLSGNSLGDVLTGIDNLYYNITNVNQTIHNQLINVNLTITNWNSEINNTVVNININLTNVNSTLYNEIINIDASINNLQTNVTWQIQNLSISMNNNFTNIQTQITTVNNTVLSVNSTLIRVNNTIINQITNLNNSMTYQFTHVITNITNVNNTLYQQTQTIKEDIVDLAHTEYRNPPPEPTKVPVVGDLVTSEAGQVIAGFGIILAIIFAFMYVVERGRRISIEEERSAKRMINALKK